MTNRHHPARHPQDDRDGTHTDPAPSPRPRDGTPLPSPGPEPCPVPAFEPLRLRGPRHRLRRAARRARHALPVLLALTAAVLTVTDDTAPPPPGAPATTVAARARPPAAPARPMSVPVRIADAATVRLLRPGDRVDVIAAPSPALGGGTETRVVARDARVTEVPRPDGNGPDGGALVVLSVPRPTAAALAGAAATSPLAVTLW